MAGTNSDFDAGAFRDGILLAMRMGMPVDTTDQPTFHFPPVRTHTADHGTGLPFDPAVAFSEDVPTPVAVDCAVAFFSGAGEGEATAMGHLHPSRVEVTLMQEEYDQVVGASSVVIGGDVYRYRFTEPPVGLFDVGVYVMHFTAEDES